MIQSIIMENVKGQNCEQPLTGRDIITGPNGSGKTTRIQSLGIAMLGYVPGAGKLPADTYKLCSGENLTAGLKTDDFMFSRTFTKTVKENKKSGATEIKISQDITLSPGKGESNLAQKEARIMAEIGSFPVMLNFGEFVGMTDTKRREFIYNLSPVKVKDWDLAKIKRYLTAELLTEELKENNPDKFTATAKVINDVIGSYPKGFDVQAGLTAMIDFSKRNLSYWKEEQNKAEGASKKLSDMKNKLAETDRDIAANKAELEEVQKKLMEITAQIAADQEKIKANKRRQGSIDGLLQSIENIKASQNPYVLSDLQTALKAEKDKLVVNGRDYTKIRAELQAQSNELDRQITASQKRLDDLAADPVVKKAVNDLAVYKSTLNTIKSMNPDDRRCVISHSIGCNKDFTNYVKMAEDKIVELDTLIRDNESQKAEIKAKIQELNQQKSKINDDINLAYVEERREMSRIQLIRDNIIKLEGKIKDAESFDGNKANRIAEKQTELEKLQNIPAEAVADINAATILKTSYISKIESLKKTVTEKERAKITIQNEQASMIDNKIASYNADAYKFISDSLGVKGIQGEIVKSILDPIRADVQEKFHQLGIPYNFYFTTESDTGKEVFQFGWAETVEDRFEGPKQVHHNFDALSTGEQLLLMSALMITIIERSNPKLKVLVIDNLNDLDEQNFRRVMHGLSIIGGSMDNIILSGVVSHFLKESPAADKLVEQYEGFKVWELTSVDDKKAV